MLAVFLLVGCSSTAPLSAEEDAAGDKARPAHTLIYVIHGDGGYLYHENGTARRADRKALKEAKLVAEHAPGAEVFIFHQRPERRFLGLFARSDGTFYHYRAGEQVEKKAYRRDPSGTGLSREAALYRERRHPEAASRALLYYGHEVEEEGGERYHGSHPVHAFGLSELVGGLKQFGAEEDPFDLLVLSTCNNGTPGTLHALASLARYVIAAPGDLHLSYIDSHPLHRLGQTEEGIERVAQHLARWAFERLSARTETAVTLALYDTERLQPFLARALPAYEATRARLPEERASGLVEYVDCRDEAMPGLQAEHAGVERWYRPPAFGAQSQKEVHSGWACPQLPGAEMAAENE